MAEANLAILNSKQHVHGEIICKGLEFMKA